MDEILTIEVFEPVLIGIVGVGTMVKLMSRGVLDPVLVTSILGRCQNTCNDEGQALT